MQVRKLITVGLVTLLLSGPVFAQAPSGVFSRPPASQMQLDIRGARRVLAVQSTGNTPQAPTPKPERSLGRKVAWGLLGGVGGFFGGAFLGEKIERSTYDCNCDDPGLKGFLIGAPVGTIVGAIVGVKLASR